MTEYAMYRGDVFVDLGTLDYLSKKYHKTVSNLKWLSYPSEHKRKKKTLLYRIEEDDDD